MEQDWINDALAELEMTTEDLASATKRSVRSVQRWIEGSQIPPREVQITIAIALNRDVTWVFGKFSHSSAATVPEPDLTAKSLSELADTSTLEDVAVLCDLPADELAAAWDDTDWPDRLSASALQTICALISGAGEYFRLRAGVRALRSATANLNELGIRTKSAALANSACDPQVQRALRAAIMLLQAPEQAAAYIARMWGRPGGEAFRDLLCTERYVANPETLRAAALTVADQLRTRQDRDRDPASSLALAILLHRLPSESLALRRYPTTRSEALTYRSASLRRIIVEDDFAMADRYCDEASNGVLRGIEVPAWATYSGDCPAVAGFEIAHRLRLTRTVALISDELMHYPPAYLHYLVRIGLPSVMRADPQVGSQQKELGVALQHLTTRPGVHHRTVAIAKQLNDHLA